MWVVFVEFLLQCFNKFLLAPVDVFNIPKDCLQLFFCKHVGSFAALLNVTLRGNQMRKLGTDSEVLGFQEKTPVLQLAVLQLPFPS